MISHDLYVEILTHITHIKDPTTIRNYVRCDKNLSLIGRKQKENIIQQLIILQTNQIKENLVEKYYILPNQVRHGLY